MNNNILLSMRSSLLERLDLSEIPEELWKRSSALNTWGTNAIEGSTITWKDAQRILLENRSVANRPIRDVLETVQHERAFRGLMERRKKPISLVTIQEIHEDVFKGVIPDAGLWRMVNVRIYGASFRPPRMEAVVKSLENLMNEYRNRDMVGEDVFTLSAWFHFEFERIHPFSDGNGRVGRLLLNLHFLKHNWPPVHILPNDREAYLGALSEMEKGNDVKLVSLFKRLMASSMVDMLDTVGTDKDKAEDLRTISERYPYSAKYISLRCGMGELPGVLSGNKWKTSDRAMELYMKYNGRK